MVQVPVVGRGGVGSGAGAVALNVTAVGARAGGFVTVWPCGEAMPDASNLNFAAGQTIANFVVSKVGAGGRVCVFTSAATDLLIDVVGMFNGGDTYRALSPARLADSRDGGSTIDGRLAGFGVVEASSVVQVPVVGRGGVGSGAGAVALNVTAVGARADGFVTVWPCGEAMPDASNLNFAAGQTIANFVVSKVGDGGRVCVFTSAATDLLVDVVGVFDDDDAYRAFSPARLIDSRSDSADPAGRSGAAGIRAANSTTAVHVTGSAGVRPGTAAVTLNVTAVGARADGFVTVWPCGEAMPDASNLNFAAGQTIANSVVSKVGDGGRVCVFTSAATDLLVDIAGAFRP